MSRPFGRGNQHAIPLGKRRTRVKRDGKTEERANHGDRRSEQTLVPRLR